jgi:hypothetical protein
MIYDIKRLTEKVTAYKKVLANTVNFRKEWNDGLKEMITDTLTEIIKKSGLKAKVEYRTQIENLEAIVLDLGRSSSGLVENVENSDIRQIMIKHNGSLIYQQLFNGKIMVMFESPSIENYSDSKPAKFIEILRPDEFNPSFIYRHMEAFLKDITDWEDFDDTDQIKNPIGFHPFDDSQKE